MAVLAALGGKLTERSVHAASRKEHQVLWSFVSGTYGMFRCPVSPAPAPDNGEE